MLHGRLSSNSACAQAGIGIRHAAQVRRCYRGEVRLKGALRLRVLSAVTAVEVAGALLQRSRRSWRRASQRQISAGMNCCRAREVLEAAGAGVSLRQGVQRSWWWWRGWRILPWDGTPNCRRSRCGGVVDDCAAVTIGEKLPGALDCVVPVDCDMVAGCEMHKP